VRNVFFALGSMALMASVGCMSPAQREFANRLKGTPAPDFDLSSLHGDRIRLSDLRGKPVVLAFFAYG